VTGTISQLHRDRGTGSLIGEDGRTYSFRRSDLENVWFHELTEGAPITFEPTKQLSACQVRLRPNPIQ
jgi:hypothetical protein